MCEMVHGPLDGEMREIYDDASHLHVPVLGTFVPNRVDGSGCVIASGKMDLHVYNRFGKLFIYAGINAW